MHFYFSVTEFECCIFFLILPKGTNIENRVQIRPILYSSKPIRLQIFFRVSDNKLYVRFKAIKSGLRINLNLPTIFRLKDSAEGIGGTTNFPHFHLSFPSMNLFLCISALSFILLKNGKTCFKNPAA